LQGWEQGQEQGPQSQLQLQAQEQLQLQAQFCSDVLHISQTLDLNFAFK